MPILHDTCRGPRGARTPSTGPESGALVRSAAAASVPPPPIPRARTTPRARGAGPKEPPSRAWPGRGADARSTRRRPNGAVRRPLAAGRSGAPAHSKRAAPPGARRHRAGRAGFRVCAAGAAAGCTRSSSRRTRSRVRPEVSLIGAQLKVQQFPQECLDLPAPPNQLVPLLSEQHQIVHIAQVVPAPQAPLHELIELVEIHVAPELVGSSSWSASSLASATTSRASALKVFRWLRRQ